MKKMYVTFKTSDKIPKKVQFRSDRTGVNEILKTLVQYRKGNRCPNKKSSLFEDSSGESLDEIIQSSEGTDNYVALDSWCNGFVHTVARAYNQHHNLILRPEDFWTAILTQFSMYVNANAEKLRDTFVDFQGKKELTVKTAGTLRTVNYGELSKVMTLEIQKNLKNDEIRDWILPNFSTTTDNDRIVSSVVMMASMQKYFDYKFSLDCGVPKVTLLGTPNDYKELRARIEKLLEFEIGDSMKKWYSYLVPIFDELIRASNGDQNYDFWTRICDYRSTGSGPTYLSGWITAFCVFDDKGVWQGDKTKVRTWNNMTITNKWPIINTHNIPPGYCTVPVTVDDNGTEYNTIMFAGSFAMNMVNSTTLAPRQDWAIVLK